jgi:hypothetical protein
MWSEGNLDERFLDRGGCGDELYGDAHQRASLWLAQLDGARSLSVNADLDGNDDAAFDDVAAH